MTRKQVAGRVAADSGQAKGMNEIKIQRDMEQTPMVRRLRRVVAEAKQGLASPVTVATRLWVMLWLELGLQQDSAKPAGVLDPDAARGYVEECNLPEGEKAQWETVVGWLVEAGILIAYDGEGGGWFCPKYAELNAGGGGTRSQAQRGGDLRAFTMKQQRVGQDAMQLGLRLSAEKFKDAEGRDIEGDEAHRVMMLVIGCDNALFRESRPAHGFTATIMANGARVTRQYTEAQIQEVLRTVALRRGHPMLAGLSTERLLADFGDMVRRLQ